MAPELNELLEQGITRCGELTDAADQAMEAVFQIKDAVQMVEANMGEELSEARERVRELSSKLQHAEGDLESAREEGERALETLAQKAEELKTEAGHVGEGVKKHLGDLESHIHDHDSALDSQAAVADQELHTLAQQTQEAQAKAEHHLEQAMEAVAALREAINTARDAFAQKHHEWTASADALQAAAHQQAEAWTAALSHLLMGQAALLVQTLNTTVDHHNQVMEEIRGKFAHQAPQDIAEGLRSLEQGLEEMGEDAADRAQDISTDAGRMEEFVHQTLPVVDSIHAAVEEASHV